jgi:hypothetical protein
MHPLGLFPAEKRDDPMWCNRVSHVKDVWAMYPDLVGRITVQCMSALYRLQALQSDDMAHLANLAQTTKLPSTAERTSWSICPQSWWKKTYRWNG